jgi:hypothetical protein
MLDDEFRDELDKASIDQLHKAVLQISGNCFEIKRLCVTVLISAATLISVFTEKKLDLSLFTGSFMAIMFFWLLDAQNYYYQEKLRARMKELGEGLASRHLPTLKVDGIGMPLSDKREERSTRERVVSSLANYSMIFYLLLALVNSLLLVAYLSGLIGA